MVSHVSLLLAPGPVQPEMAVCLTEEVELIERHEAILRRRAELLEHMESLRDDLRDGLKVQRRQQEAAVLRNSTLLQQQMNKIEDGLRESQLPCPRIQALETRYWASVEESIPVWEHFLLGKGPHPTHGPGQPPRIAKQKPSTAKDQSLPPRPKPRTAR